MRTLLLKTVIGISLLIITTKAPTVTADAGSIKLPEVDLRRKWLQAESMHFRITYPASLGDLSITITEEAEYVYEILSSWTDYYPPKKIDILLTDSSDAANGFTKYGPSGLFVSIYAVHPYAAFNMSIDEYKNWYRHLLIHELSHYFHLNRVEGLPKIARRLLGNIIYPNSTTPLFVREGFATYSETRNESGFGRGNSGYTDMFINTSVLQDDFTPLDRAANRSPVWPGSEHYYLFGVSFFNYLALQYGEEKVLHFSKMSSRYTPYTWGIAFKREFGKSMHEMWDEWENYEKSHRTYLLKSITKEEITVFEPIGKSAGYLYSLSFDSDGKRLAYSMSTSNDTGGIYIYDFKERREKQIKADRAAYDISFSGNRLLYIRMEREHNVNIRKNIYTLDIQKRRERRITKSGAVQSFTLIPDKEDILLVCMSTPEGTEIRLIDLKGNVLSVPMIAGTPVPVILEEPAISPDGKRIVFSGKYEDGKRVLFIAHVQELLGGKFTLSRVEMPSHCAYSPRWINNHEILFVDGESGTFNLYLMDVSGGSATRITNVTTGVFIPDISKEGTIAVSEYTSRGFRPAYIKIEALSDFAARYTKSISESGPESHDAGTADEAVHQSYPAVLSPPVRYRSYRYLSPGYWLPVWCSENINLGLGVHTHGNDLLNRHRYDISLVYDIIDTSFKNEVGYTFNTDSLSFSANMFLSQDIHAGSFSPSFALEPAVWYQILKSTYIFRGKASAILEDPFFGPAIGIYFSNIKVPPQWCRPKKGVVVSQELFFNRMDDPFTVLSSTLSGYYAPARFLLVNLALKNKTGFGNFNDYIQSGSISTYAYAPLNGVLTRGYPQPVSGSSVTDCKLTVSAPILTVYRGIHAFPLFLKGIYLNLYSDNGMIIAPSSPYTFVATNIGKFAASPLQYIRSSAGAEIVISTVIGYEFPFEIAAGYVYPFSPLGESGVYLKAGMGLTF